jgi:hypothetical protein
MTAAAKITVLLGEKVLIVRVVMEEQLATVSGYLQIAQEWNERKSHFPIIPFSRT